MRDDSHSRRHLRRLCRSSEALRPRPPNEAAPAPRHRGNREPASRCWEVSSCWHSKGTQSWESCRDEERGVQKEGNANEEERVKAADAAVASPVVCSRYHVLLVYKLDTINGTPVRRQNIRMLLLYSRRKWAAQTLIGRIPSNKTMFLINIREIITNVYVYWGLFIFQISSPPLRGYMWLRVW